MNGMEPISRAYLRSDLRQIVHALAMASRGMQRGTEYSAGFADALAAVAVAVGVEQPVRIVEPQMIDADWPPAGCPRGHEQRRFVAVGER